MSVESASLPSLPTFSVTDKGPAFSNPSLLILQTSKEMGHLVSFWPPPFPQLSPQPGSPASQLPGIPWKGCWQNRGYHRSAPPFPAV